MAVLLGAEVERGREKQPLCRSDMKATGCDRKNHQTAGRSRRNLSLSHTGRHSNADIYTDHTDQMSVPLSQDLYVKLTALLMVNRSVMLPGCGKSFFFFFCYWCLSLFALRSCPRGILGKVANNNYKYTTTKIKLKI